jgi:hypothetical protein
MDVALIGDSGAAPLPDNLGAVAALIGAVVTAVATLTPIIRNRGTAPALVNRRTGPDDPSAIGGIVVAVRKMVQSMPGRRYPRSFGVAKVLWYVMVTVAGVALAGFEAYVVLSGRSSDTRRDGSVAILAAAVVLYAGVSCGNAGVQSWRRWKHNLSPTGASQAVSFRVTGDRRQLAERCMAAMASARLRVHSFDLGDSGWVRGLSTYAGDFLGGTVVLRADYRPVEAEGCSAVDITCDVLREGTALAWGRPARASQRFARAFLAANVSPWPAQPAAAVPTGNGRHPRGAAAKLGNAVEAASTPPGWFRRRRA